MSFTIDNFIEKVFRESPKEKNSISLEFDNYENANENNLNKVIFDELVYVLTNGIKIIYGSNINIENISDNDIKLINKYFNSFGFMVGLKVTNKLDINNDI